jgi:histidinol dehydrogenase
MSLNIQVLDLATAPDDAIAGAIQRSAIPDPIVQTKASAIVNDIRARGDLALAEYATRFGGGLTSGDVMVEPAIIEAAGREVDELIARALDTAIRNVHACHEPQRPTSTRTTPSDGVTVERVWTPVSRVGVYVPGGRAVYPSSLIMGVVPALVAGVKEICVATPARRDGSVDPVVLAAAAKLGIDQVYAMGGAQAIGALAYGTGTIVRVDKIVGPGGPWVTAGKLAVYGVCGVDLPAGPSEAAIIADDTANTMFVAADVMCQAEHGEESAVMLVTSHRAVAAAVLAEIERQLPALERSDIITKALENHGRIVIAPDHTAALAFANSWAPEHLSIHTASAAADAADVWPAGCGRLRIVASDPDVDTLWPRIARTNDHYARSR